ncbi:MAG: LytR C-terminal domain-containing protein [Acidimicrobiales bacterium]|nr:LytR C-terminal domain-containing protein [Acidimicrobiales bacterium]MCB9394317.1 LytR C-terminal domain-containing protein [Acidimicrobiaceae bacterium]
MPGHPLRTRPDRVSTALATSALLATLLVTACSDDSPTVPSRSDATSTPPSATASSSTDPASTPSPEPPITATPSTPPSTPPSTTSTLPPVTTTTFPFVNQGTSVIVANAADVPGAATEYTDALGDFGFTMEPPTNGAGNEEIIEVTRIYATSDPTSQAVALSVARVMGELPVERMPTPAPIENATEGLGAATVLVMLGKDLAGRPLPGPPGA